MDLGFRLFTSVISAKERINPPSLKISFAQEKCEIRAARDHSVFVSCWASSHALLEQVLGGTYAFAYGDASGFFCVQT